ncbi:amino acid adenylation domain-containing protein [Streptomyces albus]|uniref:Amino acid adenylation domain-containing protein n=1 Tax=Streptomyces albus (strain ATCC 21838 / DSM 41398 / FERM P-419 / JCM 4703 / NBRC 107858) TaxID=1081613 RepID=A0A0B5EQR2_STRA4|nr:amino acid adenylation domain-containing protein [Streptomyces albus]
MDHPVGLFALSAAQKDVWIAHHLDPEQNQHNCGGYIELRGPLDEHHLAAAVRQAHTESQALRVRFSTDAEDTPWQQVADDAQASLETRDFSGEDDPRAAAEDWVRADLATPVDLLKGPLLTHTLLRLAPEHALFHLRYHHIVLDGYGQMLYWRRIAHLYTARCQGTEATEAIAASLADLLDEEDTYRRSDAYDSDLAYWRRQSKDWPDRLSLGDPHAGTTGPAARYGAPAALRGLGDRAAAFGTHWSVIALAATAAYLRRLSPHDDLVLGMPVRARTTRAALTTPAMLANVLPLRLSVSTGQSFASLVEQVAERVGELLAHQRLRGEELARELRRTHAVESAPGVVVNVIGFDNALTFDTLTGTVHQLSVGPVRDLALTFFGGSDGSHLRLTLDAHPALHDAGVLDAHRARLTAFLDRLADTDTDLQCPLGDLDLLTGAERTALAAEARAHRRDWDLERPVHDLVRAQAARTPDALAVESAGTRLTYRELTQRTQALAAELRTRGVRRGDIVAVCDERSPELAVSLLAVLETGAAYLPLDPELPRARLEFQLTDSGARHLVTRTTLTDRLPATTLPTLNVDTLPPTLTPPTDPPPTDPAPDTTTPDTTPTPATAAPVVGPEDTAYVLYTSGSTGRPKAVAVPHRGVVNRLLWMQDAYRLTPDDKVLQKTPFTFDVSVWEFFWPLLNGAVLHLAAPGAHRDPRALARTIDDHGVTTVHFVPSMLDLFLTEPAAAPLPTLRRVVCSGEALRPETIGRFFERHHSPGTRGPDLYNLYGPTEASIDVTHWHVSPADAAGPVPIGRPVANTSLYVLDPEGRPLPPGTVGELHIGGVQVASGYLHRPDLTAASFLPDPFGPGTLYKTGDAVLRRTDGVLLYRGRLDDQVKVNGLRIEPGEIESALLEHPRITQAVVSAPQEADGRRQLIAHLVPDGPAPDTGELLALLRRTLPAHMTPAHFVTLDALPLLPNGKLDRAALPTTTTTAATATDSGVVTAPATEAEHLLHRAWCTVLGIAQADVDASFFALGGDSMHAIRVRAETERGGHTFTVADLLQGPSIRELATHLRPLEPPTTAGPGAPFALLTDADRALLPDGLDDAYPLSAMQTGMLYHAALAEDSSVYRVVTSVRISRPLDLDALTAAVADTVRRHPSLRCSFDLARYSEPLQLVHHQVRVPVERGEDLIDLSESDRRTALRAWVERAKFTRFDTAHAPLLKFTAHPCTPASFELSVIEHHVVLDGWSDMRMLEEITAHYAARLTGTPLALPEVPSTYRDFVAAERRALADDTSRAYWADLLHGAEPTHLPTPTTGTETGTSTTGTSTDTDTDTGTSTGTETGTSTGTDTETGTSTDTGTGSGTGAGSGSALHRRYDIPVAPHTARALTVLARREGLPLKALLTAAHLAVLRLASGDDEVLTGVVANARLEEAGGDETIGVFLNTLPLRLDLSRATLAETARLVFAHERASAPHRRYPFAQMQQDTGESLRLDSYVNFMDFHAAGDRGERVPMTVTAGIAETNYPLAANFLIDPDDSTLTLWLDCDLAALPEDLCTRLPGYYQRALTAVAEHSELPLVEADLMDEAEHARLARFNDTALAYDHRTTVHEQFAHQARTRPEAIALVHRHTQLTYGELDARANRLAHHLRAHRIGPGDLVGVSLRRGPDLVTALLAVLKTGAAYVPLDPSFPTGRLEHIATDARIACLLKGPGTPDTLTAAHVIDLTRDADLLHTHPATAPDTPVTGEDTAYVIYTSGSTGTPKGTALRHRNALNFFAGMDQRIGCTPHDTVLAVTSVSFDISVTELLWPLTHGAKVVIAGERLTANLTPRSDTPQRPTAFSLFFFAASAGASTRDGYRLVLEAARFADRHGFEAVWTPERHFHAFGGLYPNPSVLSAALATATERIALRCGSVVAPLHDTLRIAEEWSLVDNLSGGRTGLAFAAGWNSNDFVLRPANFADRKDIMSAQLEEFRRLWRGQSITRTGGSGQDVEVTLFPAPVQAEPPIWLTSVGTLATFRKAGASGANLLTHLFGQSTAELAEKIDTYRTARAEAGHQGPGQVTVMVHTFLSDDTEDARRRARDPFRAYLRSSTELWRTLFTATGKDLPEMGAEEQIDAVIDLAIDRYFETSGLFGSPDTCADLVRDLSAAGVDEIACLVDFGLETDAVLESLTWVDVLRDQHAEESADSAHSLTELCARHDITLLQGTPSLLAAIAAEPAALSALAGLRALLVGGEAFPPGLARRLTDALPATRLFNMYGPTETTIWSTVHALDAARDTATVPIGRPLANTEARVVDERGRQLPVGVSGELWIGGDGVAAGYLHRPELTAERFVTAPGTRRRFYRTGDRVSRRPDGSLEFLGRVDRQVKILGHRVEPDEVESVLSRHPGLDAVAVTAVEAAHGTELVAYVSPAGSRTDTAVQDAHVQHWGEVWESAYTTPHHNGDSDSEGDGDDGGGENGERGEGAAFAGWLSSYTGEAIPLPEMRQWLAHTVEAIRALKPTALADIGVGQGLVLRSLAGEVAAYHGVDLSPTALTAAAASLGHPLPEHVTLHRSGPEYLATLAPRSLDTVVINSVAQYFPSTDYLRTVLTDALRALAPGGAVFLGDVRSVEMLPAFHTAVQLHRATPLQSAGELRAQIAWHLGEERELCLSPAFFHHLAGELGEITEVRIELKRGTYHNELSLFRYDVTLLTGPRPPAAPARQTTWQDCERDLEVLRTRLAAASGPLLVRGIPNSRLAPLTAAAGALAELDEAATAWDLDRLLWEREHEAGLNPEDLHTLAAQYAMTVRTLVPDHGHLDTFDAHFTPATPAHPADPAAPADQSTRPADPAHPAAPAEQSAPAAPAAPVDQPAPADRADHRGPADEKDQA